MKIQSQVRTTAPGILLRKSYGARRLMLRLSRLYGYRG